MTEQSSNVPFHSVIATVNVTVKDIPEIAVDNSGSMRFLNITPEKFIIPESDVSTEDLLSKTEKHIEERKRTKRKYTIRHLRLFLNGRA